MRIRNVEYGYEIDVSNINGEEWTDCVDWLDDCHIIYGVTFGGVSGTTVHDYITFEQKADAIEFKMRYG